MLAQQGLALAETVVKFHFGEIVSKVVGCLLHRGSLALPEIVRFVRLPPPQVRSSLLALIQHNCVQAFSIERPAGLGGAIRNVTQYTALFYNILQRMRFTKFSAIVNADLGEQCEYLLEGLLQHGRLTFDQLAVRVTLKHPGGSSSVEQQVTIAAAVSHAERFCEIPDMGTNTMPNVKVTDHSPGVSVGDKACVEHIKSRSGPNAGIVLEAMIESNHEQKAKDNNSVMSSMDDILEGVKVKPGGSSMTLENVRKILVEELGCRLSDEETEALHTINLKNIIETCQNDEVEALVVKRYGDEARRIFTLLAKKGIYENDQIHNAALLVKMKTEGILYKFWKDDYLDMKRAISSEDGRQKHNFFVENEQKRNLGAYPE
ncbi:DNA-directed RNA polymerase III subunit RPC3 isoform X2 [Iris pallida]|uniref:DNA-directed RNA polymerase III subunit RPC3 n=1 Tax=Iris pallida TaxID=29817 RepID=A0AAX6H9C6_IRIPA|nr:DNA-directed RNA polymerase III subunit RPC3 isoform X2 [Iris pallida]